jgi:hypothetical protein
MGLKEFFGVALPTVFCTTGLTIISAAMKLPPGFILGGTLIAGGMIFAIFFAGQE